MGLEAGVDGLKMTGGGIVENLTISGHKRAAGSSSRGDQDAIRRIPVNVIRQLPCVHCRCWRQFGYAHPAGGLNGITPCLGAHPQTYSPLSCQHRRFPKGYRGQQHLIATSTVNDQLTGSFSQPLVTLGEPDKRMRIEQNHAPVPGSSSSRSSSAFQGPSYADSSGLASKR